ncbi:hypothetical protein CXG81DRAFT_4149, partial [Caulochytrium protostelioides]
GWGPTTTSKDLADMPFAPFSKMDRIGRIADFLLADQSRGRQHREAFGTGQAGTFAYQHAAAEEATFQLVDRSLRARPGMGQRGGRGNQRGGRGRGGGRGGRGGRGFNRRRYGGYQDRMNRTRDPSVQIGSEWKLIEDYDFHRLSKLAFSVSEPTELAASGAVQYYDKTFDRITPKADKPLEPIDRTFNFPTASIDPVLTELAAQSSKPTVFATDDVVAALMCAPRSIYSWDIVITKDGNNLWLDKRNVSAFEFISVNENAANPPVDISKPANASFNAAAAAAAAAATAENALNGPAALAEEATYINRNLSQQVLSNDKLSFKQPNPFVDPSDSHPVASAAYRYRRWSLGPELDLVVRTQIDAAIVGNAPGVNDDLIHQFVQSCAANTQLLNVRALNEFDAKAAGAGGAPEWRHKLETQRGAVMATEIKNNGNKLARWALESMLAGVDQIRLGFVSRANPKDHTRHLIYTMVPYKPREFAAQMNLNIDNGWGILKALFDRSFTNLKDGKYVMVKDPNKPVLRIYEVPANAFDEEEEDE